MAILLGDTALIFQEVDWIGPKLNGTVTGKPRSGIRFRYSREEQYRSEEKGI